MLRRSYIGWGRKVYIRERRIHHGAFGVAVLAVGLVLRHRALAALGVVLMVDDRADWPWRFLD